MTAAPGTRPPADPGRPTRPLDDLPIGIVPIVWNNADLPGLGPAVPFMTVLDEIARLGYAGCQTGVGFPAGTELRVELERRRLRLAEVYAALPCGRSGPGSDALEIGRARLADLHAVGGDILVVACGLAPGREPLAGRAGRRDVPRLTAAGLDALARVLESLALDALQLGHRVAFHQHAGTFIETPDELAQLMARTDPAGVTICLDIGHYTVGGGDPVAAIDRYRSRVSHVHLKDVAREALARLRDGRAAGFLDALQSRLFTELGSGIVDLPAVLDALVRTGYRGWLMVEQDTTWNPPSESAAIARHILEYALRGLGRRAA